MKNTVLFLILIIHYSFFIALAQSPQSFKYLTAVRDSAGKLLVNKQIAVKISILKSTANGPAVYSELDNPTTNQFGLINLEIGNGSNQTGKFDSISWGKNTYFIKIEVDIKGGTDFQTLGTRQLLSVPYALYADKTGSILMMSDKQRDSIKNPEKGMIIYNTTTNCLNVYNGHNWFQQCSDYDNCVPKPSKSDAGPDQLSLSGASATLTANTPDNGTGQWSIIYGTGGSFQSPADPNTTFTGKPANSYVLRWTITTPCEISVDDVLISFQAAVNCGTVTDVDGNVYHTVTIGTQCWFDVNLKTTKYNDGTDIPLVTDHTAWSYLTTPGYCWYNDSINYKAFYGAMYNFYAVSTGKLCPVGWHVPSQSEMNLLSAYLGGGVGAGDSLKEKGDLHWINNGAGANNSSGFTALPGGMRNYSDGYFAYMGTRAYWWSSTPNEPSKGWSMFIYNNSSNLNQNGVSVKQYGYSVRCIKD